MVLELLNAVRAEIVSDPLTFAIEIVQFVLLVSVVWIVGIGLGKRRGFVTNMLAERREKVASELEAADGSEEALATAQLNAESAMKEARAQAKRALAEARRQAKHEREAAAETADREAEALREHGRQLLEMERQEMLADARERLLEIVGSATRHILSERLSPAEQRGLVQHAIMESLEGDQTEPPERPAAPASSTPTRRPAEATTA